MSDCAPEMIYAAAQSRAYACFVREDTRIPEDAILYTSRFDANGGLFETLLGEPDAVISDALNHASIIERAVAAFVKIGRAHGVI